MKHLPLAIGLLTAAACAGHAPVEAATTNLTSVVSVVPVADHAAATAWYARWIGRDADLVPMDGPAEWQLARGGWLQVALDPDHAGETTVALTVLDLEAQRAVFADAAIPLGDVQDYGFVRLVEVSDPDGNTLVFVQETP